MFVKARALYCSSLDVGTYKVSRAVWLMVPAAVVDASVDSTRATVIAVALGAFIAGETFTSHDIGAMVVILAGVVVITLARARQAK